MKILKLTAFLFFSFFLFCTPRVRAQAPTVTVQAGYPVGRPASQVAYGNGKYVLLTTYQYNQVFQSASGTAWSTVSTSGLTTGQLNFMVYGAGVFVAVGNGGMIQTSADGSSWTTRPSGTTADLVKVYFVNNTFFAIGKNRTLLTSADGLSWEAMVFGAGDPADFFMSLTYGNGVYVLSARKDYGSQAIIYRSATATNNSWTVTTNSLAPATYINRIQFLNNRFFVFTAGNDMYQSTDGISWTNFTASVVLTQPDGTTRPWGLGHQIFNGVWDGTSYHFYGSSSYYSGYGSTFTSTDGVNFTLIPKTAYIVPQESTIINGIYFICGNEGIVSSADGLVYKHSGTSFTDMVKTANKYVAVGGISSDGLLCNTADFTNWTSRGPANIREVYTVAYDGSTVLAGGYTGIYSSSDEGDSWTKVFHDANETTIAMTYGAGRFVAAGYNNDGPFLRYSTNSGVSWTTANTLNNYYNKVRYVNNRFFALGSNGDEYEGRILTSTDGISWTDVTPALGFTVYYYNDVVFDGTRYHVLGIDADYNFFTVSTATPATASSYGNKAVCINIPAGVTLGGNWDQGLLTYSNGQFTGAVIDVVTGQDYIITSTDGSSWTALPQASFGSAMAAYTNGNTVQMVARGNTLITVQYDNLLPVRMLHFEGSLAEKGVQLRWSTATEQNSLAFAVEHSTDGRVWKRIGTVNAAGNSSSRQEYSLLHTAPMEGINYYRLQQQDRDGASTYSRVVTVRYGKALQASLYPNPVKAGLTVRTGSAQPGSITLFTTAGQPVKRAAIQGFETSLDVSGLPAGVYLAEIRQGNQQLRLSVVKE
jgi:hypothetical protein